MGKKMRVKPALLGLSFVYFYSIAASQEVENLNVESDRILHHDLKVFLDPESRQISVEDVITLPENLAQNVVQFSLNSDLSIIASKNLCVYKLDMSSFPHSLYSPRAPPSRSPHHARRPLANKRQNTRQVCRKHT